MAYNRRGIRIISLANSDKLSGAKVWYQTLRNHHDYCLPPYPFREPGQSHPLYKKEIFISSAMAGYALPNFQGKNAHHQRHCQEELVPRLYF